MSMQESGEMYLETILILSQDNSRVRAVDVGRYMGFSKPSVSRALGLLKTGGFVTVEEDGSLFLTVSGADIANKMYERHKLLTSFFTELGVSEKTASEDACKLEHDLSEETFEAICRHVKLYQKKEEVKDGLNRKRKAAVETEKKNKIQVQRKGR